LTRIDYIRIEDLDLMDFSEVVDPTADRLPLIHPGEILHEDFLKPLGLSQYALAKAITCRKFIY